jgi:hypothetical protein
VQHALVHLSVVAREVLRDVLEELVGLARLDRALHLADPALQRGGGVVAGASREDQRQQERKRHARAILVPH